MGRETLFSFQLRCCDKTVPLRRAGRQTAHAWREKRANIKGAVVSCLTQRAVPNINIHFINPWAHQVRGMGWGTEELEDFPMLFVEGWFFRKAELKG